MTPLAHIIVRGSLCACGEAATRTVGAFGYCQSCADELLGPLRSKHGVDAVGRGRGFDALLACDTCGATWVGPYGETCAYCQITLDNQRRWQAEILLHPELPEDADLRPAALAAWGERLGRGVLAGIVSPAHAAVAVEREGNDHAA